MRYRVLSAKTTLIITSTLSGLGILLGILCIVGGITPNAFENSAIATFDTTALRTTLSNTSHAPAIDDWYSLHMTTVCAGSWTPATANRPEPATKEKNNATMICTPYGLSFNFALGSLLAQADPTLPESLTEDMDSQLHADIGTSTDLLIAGVTTGFLALCGLFAASFKHGFGPLTHAVCVAGVVFEFISAVFVLAGAATLTVSRARLVAASHTPEGIQSYTSESFMTLLWVAAVVPLVAGGIGIIGQHKEKRVHTSDPKGPPIKIPSVSSAGSSPKVGGRSRGGSVATMSNGNGNGQRSRAASAGVASLKLGISESQGSAGSTASTANGGRSRGNSLLPPTGGSFGGRRYGV